MAALGWDVSASLVITGLDPVIHPFWAPNGSIHAEGRIKSSDDG